MDDAEETGFTWQRDRVLNDWQKAMEYAHIKLMTTKTKVRIQFLNEELLALARQRDLSLVQALDVFKLLTSTYPRYIDTPSRDAVENVGVELVKSDEFGTEEKLGVTEQILGWLLTEVNKVCKGGLPSSYASSDLFVLLSWACSLYTTCLDANKSFPSTRSWQLLIESMSILLDHLLNESTRAKPSLKKSALMRTRRALRSAPQELAPLMSILLSKAKSGSSPLKYVPFLGISVDVSIRLKNQKDESLGRVTPEIKTDILSLYTNSILMTKVSVPTHASSALHDFFRKFVTVNDLSEIILPVMEKANLRSPEHTLNVTTQTFNAISFSLEGELFCRILTISLNSAKSTNPTVRAHSVDLFKVIIQKNSSEANCELAATNLLSLPKASKTAGPDHRIALYSMLDNLSPSLPVSTAITQAAPSLISKETNSIAVSLLVSALSPHMVFLLRSGQPLGSDDVVLIAKEMTNSKPAVRRAFCTLAGSAIWDCGDLTSEAAESFAQAILPSLEASLNGVSANALNSPGGPLEGYIALALLLGPFARSGKFDDKISRNPVIQTLSSSSSKPSFLLWDKVYKRASDSEDEKWLLRAAKVTATHCSVELESNEQMRTQLGLLFLHLALESQSISVRQEVHRVVEALVVHQPILTNRIIREAVTTFLGRGKPALVSKAAPDTAEGPIPWTKHGRLSALLTSSVCFGDDVDLQTRENLLVELIIIAHHHLSCGPSRQTWIELCQKARADPCDLVSRNVDRLFDIILFASSADSQSDLDGFPLASYRAMSTLAFVSPNSILPRFMKQLHADMNLNEVNSITKLDLGIWLTPEGTTYVDVLSSNKREVEDKKGKNYELAKWEADVRKSIANKKSSTSTSLSKQEQALVNAQLEKESSVRRHVSLVKSHLERGLHFIESLLSADLPELRSHLSSISSLLLEGALKNGLPLVGRAAFDTYLNLSNCTSERLDTFRRWVGVATLRCLHIELIPEELQEEPLGSLLIRVLYRLRSLSEQAPFDAATFSYLFPLLRQVVIQGGIELEEEDPLEQVALALSVIKFHCGEFSDGAFPRRETMEILLLLIRQQPKLSKEASSALIELGEAISGTAMRDEIEVLVRGTLVQEVYVRNSCLQSLQPFDLTDFDWSPELWIACHDDDEQNARLAQHIWEDNGLDVPGQFIEHLLGFLEHDNSYVRASSAAAIADAAEHAPQALHTTFEALGDFYREKAKILAPEMDEYGMVIAKSLDRSDPWPARAAVARTFELLAPLFSSSEVEPFFIFLIKNEALGDRTADVRRGMLAAGTAVIDIHGSTQLASLISMFEGHLAGPSPATESADQIHEAVVIFFGRVARHLGGNDPRIPSIVKRLIEALKTPAEQVQIAVSDCLVPLVQIIGPQLDDLVHGLFEELFNGPKYAARRGAAYGLAGALKGTGISGIKKFDVINRLRVATEEKKKFEPRQGAMFAFETFSSTLGRLFEPYITFILPLLLTAFGDTTSDVREAAQDAARVIMGNMSGYGVKLILPSLLSGLDEKQWRTKKGSIELLGMMAYCSPRQLSLSLPIVIPRLTGVLTDSHAQVRGAANKSLKQFGEVITNPEIQSLVPVLLKALVDPVKTPNALSSLLKTTFMHYIDHSSLALVVPILERGLRERGAETKKKAAQIVGNLASLTDSKDFIPYLSELLPLVHMVLVDPVPEARATAAKALGTLVERLGEVHFPDLVPGLLRTLKTDTSGVDRQGAAQGLSEVLSGLGMERLEGLLPDIIANAQSPRSTVREGFMSLLVFLPATFGTRFQPHLPKIISPILGGLSDTEEYVREAAMRAGRMVVTNYSSKAIDLLLPELEHGMFDPGWRIRQSSITLVGELLYKVSGISGKISADEDEVPETTSAEPSRRALVEVLGVERRDRILAALYLVRQDSVNVVRQSSIHIWKALVSNTPRTVRELLPELLNQIVALISGSEFEQQETASRTTTELCRKFGEKILGQIVPILRTKSTSPDARTREGVCLTLCDVMENTTSTQREGYEDDIVTMVRVSLVDDETNVRSAAAKAFDILQEHIGNKAIDQTIPTLLEALRQPGKGSGTALQALREVMSVRASTVFPVLIPTLLSTPMTVFNARALASLVTVAGSALSKRLTILFSGLIKVLEEERDEELRSAIDEALRALLGSINDMEGLNTLMMILIGWAKHDSPKRRVSACNIFALFCEESDLDYSLYRIDWVRQLITLFGDEVVSVHTAALHAFDVFVRSVPKDELEPLVVPLRRSIESTGPPGHFVPGFSLPKGVSPTVPIIIAGLTTGSNEQREQAAYAIGDLVERTEEAAIKPFVVPFTGPLIRVATQATTYPPAVKIAILSALTAMLERIPAFVKPFFPQLQRTFVKSASDPASTAVRSRAALALGVLMQNQPRVDPVVTELVAGVKNAGDEGVAGSLVLALAHVVRSGGQNTGDKARESCVELVSDAFNESHSENYTQSIATLFASLSSHPESLRPIIEAHLVSGTTPSVLSSQSILAALSPFDDMSADRHNILQPNVFEKLMVLRSVAQKVLESVATDKPHIARPAREARDLLKEMDNESLQGLF